MVSGLFCLDLQLGHQFIVRFCILAFEVFHQAAALANFLDQTTAGGVVLLVALQVLRELFDFLGQNGDLDLRGTGVGGVRLIFFNNTLLLVWIQHSLSASFGPKRSLRINFGPEGPGSRFLQQ